MNMLFAFGQSLLAAILFALAYVAVIFALRVRVKRPHYYVIGGGMLLIVMLGGVSAGMTYGPRVSLKPAQMPDAPQRSAVVESPDLIEPSHRVGQFDEEIAKPVE